MSALRSRVLALAFLTAVLVVWPSLLVAATPTTAAGALGALSPQSQLSGFQAQAVYLSDVGKPMGARWRHQRTGLTLDVLYFESVPQMMLTVYTPIASDRGEPHICEHLLLGKGGPGRKLLNAAEMNLTVTQAATYQWHTCYDFNVVTGDEAFYQLTEEHLQALVHPALDPEEMRREVWHLGVTSDTAGGPLRLEEKGTIYDEMINAEAQPWRIYRFLNGALYGPEHPLARETGGLPEAVRQVTPEDMQRFLGRAYQLSNMNLIVALRPGMPLADALGRFDAMLGRVQPTGGAEPSLDEKLPPPQPAPPGKIQIIEYPQDNDQQPGPVALSWLGPLQLAPAEQLLMELFADTVGADETSCLYKRLVDTETRVMDVGATSVWDEMSRDQAHPLSFGLEGVAPEHMTEAKLKQLGEVVQGELKRIASLPAGSRELAAFNRQVRARLFERRRTLSKLVNSPPLFGFRSWDNPVWMLHLRLLSQTADFRKPVTMGPQVASVEKVLAGKANPWRELLGRWKALEVPPYIVAGRPSPALVKRLAAEKSARLAGELQRLKQKYALADGQAALRRFQQDYDAETARLDREAAQVPMPPFPASPPMTQDDLLNFRATTAGKRVPLVTSTFEGTSASTVGLALSLTGIPRNELVYAAFLPQLLTDVGVVSNGVRVSYDEMKQRLRREVLALSADFGSNYRSGRCELTLEASGNNPTESRRAIEWVQRVLHDPDWTVANLPRLRDVVDEALSDLRQRNQGYAENWVDDVRLGVREQARPVFLATGCFMTRTYLALRLRWRLKDVPAPAEAKTLSAFVGALTEAAHGARRDTLKALLTALGEPDKHPEVKAPARTAYEALPAEAKVVAAELVADLDATLSDIPDANLEQDWAALCQQMLADLMTPPTQALAGLHAARRQALARGGARAWMVGSTASQRQLAGPLGAVLAGLRDVPAVAMPAVAPLVTARLHDRDPQAAPVFVGVVIPAMQGSVIMNDAPAADLRERDPEVLLKTLAVNLVGGGGAHSLYALTWNAGLAYANGISSQPSLGRISYYADQVSDLPHLLSFLNDAISRAPRNPAMVDYALVEAFSSRAADSYEARGRQIASDLADSVTPDTLRRWHEALLALRARPHLADELYDRLPLECQRVLPGARVPITGGPRSQYLTIGNEEALAAYETYLQSVQGPATQLYRLYPRDFWLAGLAK